MDGTEPGALRTAMELEVFHAQERLRSDDAAFTVGQLAITAGSAGERLSYPAQKAIALLERIIKVRTKQGNLTLDPFCRCGTTIDAARRLRHGRARIDVSSFAIDLIQSKRLPKVRRFAQGNSG